MSENDIRSTGTRHLQVFPGDGPAAQFEAGHNIGGKYRCIGCGAESHHFDNLTYYFRCPKLSLRERHEFVLKGKMWKKPKGTLYYTVYAGMSITTKITILEYML